MAEVFNTNLLNVSAYYLKLLKVPVSISSLKQQLTENPYYPSLYSLSNVFDRFGIDNTAIKIDKNHFDKLTPPFLAYQSHQETGKDFVLVTSVTENDVQYIAENRKPKKVTRENFLKDFLQIVLQAQPDEQSGEKEFLSRRKNEIAHTNKTIALITASVLIFGATLFFFLHTLPVRFLWSASLLTIIKMTGIAATTLLLIYEIDKSNSFVKSICTAGKQTNCAAVLQSKASKIFGMSWSEAGFFYFTSTFLFLLFPGINFETKIVVLSIANVLAAPYILFSVYYQWKVVKQWCLLCLTVQAVLVAELIWSIVNFWSHPALVGFSLFIFLPVAWCLLSIAWCLMLPIVVWYVTKPLILKAKDESVYKAAYKRLLYNPETFNHLLQQQSIAPDGYQNIGIEIGNPEAENTIIKVCNPYCGPCAKAHPVLDEIIHNNKNVKLKLIFTASNDTDDKRGIAAKHLLAINAEHDAARTRQALDDWYLADKKDYAVFAEKYSLNKNGDIHPPLSGELEGAIEQMKKWCAEAEITFTPTLFINGHRLPEKYKIEELKYIL